MECLLSWQKNQRDFSNFRPYLEKISFGACLPGSSVYAFKVEHLERNPKAVWGLENNKEVSHFNSIGLMCKEFRDYIMFYVVECMMTSCIHPDSCLSQDSTRHVDNHGYAMWRKNCL